MKPILSLVLFLLAFRSFGQDTLQTSVKIYPVLWQQTSAEYRALCYQAFNIATLRLNEIAKEKPKEKLAIITDLDETILDNSYAEAQLIKENKEMNNMEWRKWTAKSLATAVPGAVEFLQLAKKTGVSIFYVSNRDTGDVNNTLIDMKRLQLPDADVSHMLFLSNTSSKEARRQIVAKSYNVIMLLGDNLNDFTTAFEKKPIAERFTETDKVKDEWGRRFIVLPNSNYGEWENALYKYQRNLSKNQKQVFWKELLKGHR
ncbi:5'-nucleotidase [Cytophagales bacterium WSM2-2]|nr:5'-nucleotidase [Cytophagales bacterium WSM2-2]